MDVFCINSVDIDSIECIRDPCLVSTVSTYIGLMVWLKSLESQLSKTFCGLKIGWILRKLWAGMCGCVFRVVSTVSTNIAFNAFHALIFVWQCRQTINWKPKGIFILQVTELSRTRDVWNFPTHGYGWIAFYKIFKDGTYWHYYQNIQQTQVILFYLTNCTSICIICMQDS